MFVAALEVSIFIPFAGSLKEKRSVVKSLLNKVHANFKISAAEIDDNELWQRAKLGFAIVGNDIGFLEERLDSLIRYIEEHAQGQIVDIYRHVEKFGEAYDK